MDEKRKHINPMNDEDHEVCSCCHEKGKMDPAHGLEHGKGRSGHRLNGYRKGQRFEKGYRHGHGHPHHPPHIRHEFRKHQLELQRTHRRLRLFRPFAVFFTLLFIIVLLTTVGWNGWVIALSVVFIIREVFQILMVLRVQRRIIEPVTKLKEGIESVAEGNYDVTLETKVNNEFKGLLRSFNHMANQLQESSRLKEEYELNRKNLIANITHDIKTPLTSIQGYMEAINEGVITDSDTLKRYNETILNNVVYTNKLIDDLFLFSKLDLDKVAFEFTQVEAQPFFFDMMEEMAFEVGELGFKWSYKDKLPQNLKIKIDGRRIHQSIRNVIGNAIKYGAKEELALSVDSQVEEDWCVIDISDNGPGIEEEELEYIFQRFYRIDKARTKDTMSTGLGLAITKEFIEAHDGEISIRSKVGSGTTVTIKLPVEEVVR